MSKGFDIPSNTHLGNSHDYWKAPQKNSKQIILQNIQWIKIERDRCGFFNGDVIDLFKYVPFIIREYTERFGEYFYMVTKDNFYEWSGDIDSKPKYTHILPNVPLI